MLRRTAVLQVLIYGQYEGGVTCFGISVKCKVYYGTMTSQWSVSLPLFSVRSLRYVHPFEYFIHKKMRYQLLTLIKIVCRFVDNPAFFSFIIAAYAPRVLTLIVKPFLSPKRVKIKISLFRRTF